MGLCCALLRADAREGRARLHGRLFTFVHAVLYCFQIKVGSHGGVDDRNISLFEMASSPSNVFSEALEGDAMTVGIISTFLVLGAAYRCFILRRVQSAWREFNVHVNQHAGREF